MSMPPTDRRRLRHTERDLSTAGFTLVEFMVASAILLLVSGAVTSALVQLTTAQRSVSNRVQMHSGVRSATELLQQEVGQVGLVALPGTATLGAAVAVGAQPVAININGAPSVSGIFVGELLTVGSGATAETVAVTAVNVGGNQITATFTAAHAAGAAVAALGGFASGIVPPAPGFANGSSGTVLKLYGDVNGDGNMVYVEYVCDTVVGNLYRNVMGFAAGAKPAVTISQVLLGNIQPNPNGTPCFTYEPNPLPVALGNTFVLDVAITLTIQTQVRDPTTGQFQMETKALLNVSPRNVFNTWQLASAQMTNRIQPMPPSVTALLP